MYISTTWGVDSVEPIPTKFGTFLHLTNKMFFSKFGIDCFNSLGSGKVQSLPSPTGTTTGPYHIAAVPGWRLNKYKNDTAFQEHSFMK